MEVERGAWDSSPYEMSILSKKFEQATREITQTLLKSARSGVINVARDFSSAITLHDGSQFMIDEGLPVHLGNVGLIPEYTMARFDDIAPGDCFLTNSPFAGNSHHADYTLHAPIFHQGELLFWSINKAHQADVGAPEPTTYISDAKTIFEEGPHFPAIRIQENYEDKTDIVRFLKTNLRMGSEQWYGDYKAQAAAVRAGENAIHRILDEYGASAIKQFCQDWLAYGERMMEAEISVLPEASVECTCYHDRLPNTDGDVPVNVVLTIEPDVPAIKVDLRDNIPNMQNGFNLAESTTKAGVYTGIFNALDPTIPHNEGALRPISLRFDEGKAVGKPEYPVGTSVCTSNLCDVLFNAIQSAFGELEGQYGMAEGKSGIGVPYGVISGTDFRRDDSQYINQIVYTGGGGPGVPGHDGWMTYSHVVTGGTTNNDSVEVDERKHPILFERNEFVMDSEGAGKWRGAPGLDVRYRPRKHTMTVAYLGNGEDNPPKGVKGGQPAKRSVMYKITADGEREKLPILGITQVEEGEVVGGRKTGGGGYGDPRHRDPEFVRRDVEDEFVSPERAKGVYRVLVEETDDGTFVVNEEGTQALREEGD